MVETAEGHPCIVEAQGVCLLSDPAKLRTLQIRGSLQGILVAVEGKTAWRGITSHLAQLGLELDAERAGEKLGALRGCTALSDTPWTKALFEGLACLPEEAGGPYCLWKAMELFYLLCARDPVSEHSWNLYPGGYITTGVLEARRYMETHLEEKLTISILCRQFSLSPTLLKTGFRRMCGVPIHRWLMEQRMKRACELIRTTDQSIQQIAQSVGYDGMSQFTAIFKRYYGMPPGRFKKMSKTTCFCPFQ